MGARSRRPRGSSTRAPARREHARPRPRRCRGAGRFVHVSAKSATRAGPALGQRAEERCERPRPPAEAAGAGRCRPTPRPRGGRAGCAPTALTRPGARDAGEPGARMGGGALAQREAVLRAALGEHLGLHRRHVDPRRALGLARLAPDAEVEDLPQASPVSSDTRQRAVDDRAQGVGAGAGRVALVAGDHVRGHIVPCRSCGTAPVPLQSSIAPIEHPWRPKSSLSAPRRRGSRGRPAGSVSSGRGATMTPGLSRPARVPGRLELGEGRGPAPARTSARGTPSATGRRRARPRSTRPARRRGRRRARRCGASGRRRPGSWCSAPGGCAGSRPTACP